MKTDLNVRDYLEATSDASKRTRIIMISIVVASVLTVAGFLNSFEYSWMLQRVRATAKGPDSEYFNDKFPGLDSTIKQKQYKNFLSTLSDSYVNSYTVRVPFFGITFDVNDLGVIGGLSFAILLVLFRFSLIRELDNLELSFAVAAKTPTELPAFYHLLAMRQVLLVPPTKQEGQEPGMGNILRKAPKYLHVLPTLILFVVWVYDLSTYPYGHAISLPHTITTYILTGMLLVLLAFTSYACHKVWRSMEKVWKDNWKMVSRIENSNDSRLPDSSATK